ncbi:MAG: glucose-1-phosphate adenylyltransferase, partial [Lachnospiraceae bacterium]|nr:glucose-1-phosphate adenylyltransferase [Lachnospiraceae bacterium]
MGEASEIYGEVHNSVIGSGVTIEKGAVVRDSIIMSSTTIKAGTVIDKSIIAENVVIGENCKLGVGDEVPNKVKPDVYAFGLVTIGEDSVIPDNVQIGKNTAISGVTELSDYPDGVLAGGETLIKVGDR